MLGGEEVERSCSKQEQTGTIAEESRNELKWAYQGSLSR